VLPPLSTGARQLIEIQPSPTTGENAVGAFGTVLGVTLPEFPAEELPPVALVTTENV
jgi:hypothetical protein